MGITIVIAIAAVLITALTYAFICATKYIAAMRAATVAKEAKEAIAQAYNALEKILKH